MAGPASRDSWEPLIVTVGGFHRLARPWPRPSEGGRNHPRVAIKLGGLAPGKIAALRRGRGKWARSFLTLLDYS